MKPRGWNIRILTFASPSLSAAASFSVSPMSPSSMLARCTSRKCRAVGFCDRFLHQAFFQANAQIASHDFHDVLGFERRGLREQFAASKRLSLPNRGPTRSRGICPRHLAGSAPYCRAPPRPGRAGVPVPHGAWCAWENRLGDVAEVSVLAIGDRKLGFAVPRKLRDNSPQHLPPTCSVASSQTGNGLPEKNTAEMAASSGVYAFRYSATIAIFSSFLVVAAMRLPALANLIIVVLKCGREPHARASVVRALSVFVRLS